MTAWSAAAAPPQKLPTKKPVWQVFLQNLCNIEFKEQYPNIGPGTLPTNFSFGCSFIFTLALLTQLTDRPTDRLPFSFVGIYNC